MLLFMYVFGFIAMSILNKMTSLLSKQMDGISSLHGSIQNGVKGEVVGSKFNGCV